MRKILFLIPVFLLLFGTRSLAYSDTVNNNFKEIVEEFYVGEFTSDTYPIMVLTKWESLGFENYDCVLTVLPNNACQTLLLAKNAYSVSGNTITVNGMWYWLVQKSQVVNSIFRGSGTTFSFSSSGATETFSATTFRVITEDDLAGQYEIYYNPFIVTPKISTLVESNVGYPVDAPVVPLAISFTNVPEGYYVQVQTKYYVANDITVGYDKFSSKITYTANWRESDDLTDLKAIGVGYTGGSGNNLLPADFLPQWTQLVGAMSSDDLTFSSETGLNTAMYNRGKTTYSNTFFNVLNGGNVVEIYARYYYLEDNKAYVGDWLHWFSYAPTEFYVVQPYQGEIVQGVSGTQTNEEKDLSQVNGSSLDNNITIQGGSTTTNTSVVVNVPNAYNYPTIQSFNHDNIIASFASAQANMGGLLDGFAQFASATLTWIPAQVWAVVTMGFAAALVIMIIKIL